MSPSDRLRIDLYSPTDEPEALALDRLCVQGTGYRLSFRRPLFRRRAQGFERWAIFTGRIDGSLVALAGVGLKRALLFGDPSIVGFGFDLRVHPAFRSQGLGRRMSREAAGWAHERSDFTYSWVAAGNHPSRRVLERLNGRPAASYRYLVYPTYRRLAPRRHARAAEAAEVHREHVRVEGPFDLYTDPLAKGMRGHVASWLLRDGSHLAACSAWDNSGILAEVVESLPPLLRVAGSAFRSWPLRRARLPHIPLPGEALRSWYLFDAVATRPDLGRDLLRHVAREARSAGVDFLYLTHLPSQAAWVDHLRRDLPRAFAPVLTYEMWGSRLRRPQDDGRVIESAYVDIRDL